MRSLHRRRLVTALAALAALLLLFVVVRSRSSTPSTTSTTSTAPTSGPTTSASPTSSAATANVNSLDRILYSMSGPHEGAPHGVPTSFSWAQAPSLGAVVPPAGMTAITSWGQIYADSSDARPANVRVELRNMETYVWSNSRNEWTRVQAAPQVDGAHYVEDFVGNSAIGSNLRAESDGGTSTTMVAGHNFHFWPAGERGTLPDPADVGAVYTTVQARLIVDDASGPDNRSQARYLANTGADWWRTTTETFGDGNNNPGIGQSRFTYLTADWTALDFYTGGPIVTAPGSWTEAQLRSSNPPVNALG